MSRFVAISPDYVSPSLADAITEVLASARDHAGGRCLWCHSAELSVTVDEAGSGETTVTCCRCGSELSGLAAAISQARCA